MSRYLIIDTEAKNSGLTVYTENDIEIGIVLSEEETVKILEAVYKTGFSDRNADSKVQDSYDRYDFEDLRIHL